MAEAAQPNNADAVRVSAFDCISQIANEFYPLLAPYMQVLGPVSLSLRLLPLLRRPAGEAGLAERKEGRRDVAM